MGWIHGYVVGQGQDPFLQRPPQGPGQRLGLVGRDEIGACHRVDQQRTTGEQPDGPVPVGQQPAQVLGRVPGRGQGLQHETAEVELVAVIEPAVGPLDPARPGRQHGCPVRRQLSAAGEEVGMEMGLDGERDGERGPVGRRQVGGGVAGGVDDQGSPVAQVHQVRRVAEALVDEGHHRRAGHRRLLLT